MSARIEQPGPRWLPLPFMPEMVLATLDGRKRQTRRVMQPQPPAEFLGGDTAAVTNGPRWAISRSALSSLGGAAWPPDPKPGLLCPYGQPGDFLWVRERQRVIEITNDVSQAIRVRYEADGYESGWIEYPQRLKGKPVVGKCLSYGGYRESSRLTLEVTSVRVERLQDISEEDAEAEGIRRITHGRDGDYFSATNTEPHHENWCDATTAFQHLWDSINAARGYSWESNPWVWVVGFRRVES